ncbi:2-amino-4-hydroxy-6-hydroxymethyldihydropteridine diphosphokinase, partial [Phaeobacter sp. HF9A]|uniref:2-amino-4-hydroxy-6- hydroxymethyldihydropteridine diphosphokinase n=1 Tax=Phaeobacter sp. HF9A TaxID=2721561 RepID=UPI001431CD26
MTEIRSICLVALGSNLENDGITPLATLQSCLAEFRAEALTLCAVSRFFSTPCFPAGAGPDYVNAAVMVKTSLSPAEVLAALHRIEA